MRAAPLVCLSVLAEHRDARALVCACKGVIVMALQYDLLVIHSTTQSIACKGPWSTHWHLLTLLAVLWDVLCAPRKVLHPQGFFSTLFGKGEKTDAFTGMKPAKDIATLVAQGREVGVLSRGDPAKDDVLGVQELVTYGVKGLAAYAAHAQALGRVC